MTGWALEREKAIAELDDVDEDTFILLCQFAYMGDYIVPEPSIDTPGKSDGSSSSSKRKASALNDIREESTATSYASRSKKRAKKPVARRAKKPTGTTQNDFRVSKYCDTLPSASLIAACEVQPNSSAIQNYTQVFLTHAKLYVLADKYLVENLRALCLHKLHKTLVEFTLYQKRVNDVLALVEYVFSDKTQATSEEPLRALVLEYIVLQIHNIGGLDQFASLLGQNGAFAREFWRLYNEYGRPIAIDQ
jgi:hypothetical protein